MLKDDVFHNRMCFFLTKAAEGEANPWLWHNVGINQHNQNIKPMKTSTNTSALLKAIDFELRELLKKDLENFKMVKENKQVTLKKAAWLSYIKQTSTYEEPLLALFFCAIFFNFPGHLKTGKAGLALRYTCFRN